MYCQACVTLHPPMFYPTRDMALMFLDRKAAVLVASVSIACTPGAASSTSLAPLARNGAERFGSSAMGKDQKARMAGETPGNQDVWCCVFLFSAQYSPKEKFREAYSFNVVVSGLARVKRVAKLMGRNFMRHIALSRESVAEAWLVCELWHSKSQPSPNSWNSAVFGPPHSVRTHA